MSPTQRSVRVLGAEASIEQIGRNRLVVVAHRRHLEALARPRHEALFLHQPHDTLTADVDVLLDEVLVNPWAPVAPTALVKRRPDENAQPPVLLRMGDSGRERQP